MRRAHKFSVEKNLTKIMTGNFGLAEVQALLMSLRDFDKSNAIFRELADSVAHPERERGLLLEGMEYLACKAKVFDDYTLSGSTVNLNDPFPMYFKDIWDYQLKNQHRYINLFSAVKPESVRAYIRDSFSVDLNGFLVLKQEFKKPHYEKHNLKMASILIECLNPFSKDYIISQYEIYQAMLQAFLTANIQVSKLALLAQFDKIMIILLAQLHKATFISKKIGVIEPYLKLVPGVNAYNGPIQHPLNLVVMYPLQNELDPALNTDFNGYLRVIVESSLYPSDWCEESLFQKMGVAISVNRNSDFFVNDNFKLEAILPEEDPGIADVHFSF